MTEVEWLAAQDAVAMLMHLESTIPKKPDYTGQLTLDDYCIPKRKIILFRVSVMRTLSALIIHDWHRLVIDNIEEIADLSWSMESQRESSADWVYTQNAIAITDLYYRSENPRHQEYPSIDKAITYLQSPYPYIGSMHLIPNNNHNFLVLVEQARKAAWGNRKRPFSSDAELLRDIFGNPFRTVALDPSWLTSTVVALAEGIYADRAFDRFPILADALQDAGCEDEDILTHLRSEGSHVRGCWCLDLLLGKS